MIVQAVNYNFAWNGWNFITFTEIAKYLKMDLDIVADIKKMEEAFPEAKLQSYKNIHSWAGKTVEWFAIEFIVFSFYLLSLLAIVIKSRFKLVGVDCSHQFEPLYLSKLANKIIESMNLENKILFKSYDALKRFYCDQIRPVKVEG